MRRKWLTLALMALLLLTLGQSVWAFKDIANDANADKISSLKERGILTGYTNEKFNPNGELTYAAGVSMIIKGLELNFNHIRFIKEPKASDTFPNIKDDEWYSQAFAIAAHYGMDLPEQVKADDIMSKEQFGHHLFKAMLNKGDYAFINIYMLIADEADVNPAYMDSIQKLLISKIATLDEDNNFHPAQKITRGPAAGWLYDAIAFTEEHALTPVDPEQPGAPVYDLKLSVTPVNAEINKVTVSAELPHPGYGLRISSIAFEGDQAVIHVETILPDPDKMYPMVVTSASVSTYVDAAYKPVLPESSQSGSSTAQSSARAAG